jgi:6-phosphogluconolactonase
MQQHIRRFKDLEELSRSAAKYIEKQDLFSLVLSGGNTPKRLYELFAESNMPWERIHLFWGDERCVPPDHPDSNYRLAHSAFISKVPIPPGNIHRIPAEKGPAAADEYQQTIQPFDLVLLGLGADGHTASLFPGDPAVDETTRLVAYVPRKPVSRITLTLPALNRARQALFLVSGGSKREITEGILTGADTASPAARVRPKESLTWFLSID